MSPALTTRAGVLTSGYYAMLFFGMGAHLPYWPLWLADWGVSEGMIGWILGAGIVMRVIGGTVMPALADRFAIRRRMLAAMAALSGVLMLAHLGAGSLTSLALLSIAVALVSAPLLGLGEAMGLRAAQSHGFAYSHARAIGSISFLVMVLGLGYWIEQSGPGVILYVVATCFFALIWLGWVHPGGGAAPSVLDRSRSREALDLLRSAPFLAFAAASAFGQASHAVYYTYSALAWREAGFSPTLIGALWAVGVLAEIALMFGPGRAWMARLNPAHALMGAAAAGVLRWGLMTLEPQGAMLWLLQGLHAATFGLGHLAAMAFLAAAVPNRLVATAQGLSAGLMGGLTMAGFTLLSGGFAATLSNGEIYWIATAASAIAGVAALLLLMLWKGKRLAE